MEVTYRFCGRPVPHEVVERALEMFDEQVGLDEAIAQTDRSRKLSQDEVLETLTELSREAQQARKIPEPYQPTATDELFLERRAAALLLVIARITQYLPEDRELIQELIARASLDKWGE